MYSPITPSIRMFNPPTTSIDIMIGAYPENGVLLFSQASTTSKVKES